MKEKVETAQWVVTEWDFWYEDVQSLNIMAIHLNEKKN